MAQNVVVTLDLGKDADLGRLQLFFNGATSASPDTINGTGFDSVGSAHGVTLTSIYCFGVSYLSSYTECPSSLHLLYTLFMETEGLRVHHYLMNVQSYGP